jgi:ATP-dependent Clp protease ATP-binding subunit ClpA
MASKVSPEAFGIMKASNGVLSPIGSPTPHFKGREAEIEAVIQSLSKRRMRNCILVGKSGVGKTEILRQAIKKMRAKDEGYEFLSLDVSMLQAGCVYIGQIEQRSNDIIKPIVAHNKKHPLSPICLYIDEIHVLWSVGRNEFTGTVAVSDIMKPYLSDGTLIVVGATTKDEYDKYVMKDKAMLRRLPPIFVNGMDDAIVISILKKFSKGDMPDPVCAYCVDKSKEIKYLNNPDASLEIADRALARASYYGRDVDEQDVDEVIKTMVYAG